MSVGTLLLLILILLLIGAFPRWPYNISWGYGPSGFITILIIIILLLILMGRI